MTVNCVTPTQFESAKLRKFLGNPPGKKNDPIGDQLSWVQLLDSLKPGDRLWIASADSDYLANFNKRLYLNPYLRKEVSERIGADGTVFCFDTLSEALKDFNSKSGRSMEKETGEALDEAAQAEKNIPKISKDKNIYYAVKKFMEESRVTHRHYLGSGGAPYSLAHARKLQRNASLLDQKMSLLVGMGCFVCGAPMRFRDAFVVDNEEGEPYIKSKHLCPQCLKEYEIDTAI